MGLSLFWKKILKINKISAISGTTHHGGYVHESIVYALKECGYRHIDTAKRYGNIY